MRDTSNLRAPDLRGLSTKRTFFCFLSIVDNSFLIFFSLCFSLLSLTADLGERLEKKRRKKRGVLRAQITRLLSTSTKDLLRHWTYTVVDLVDTCGVYRVSVY